MNVPKSHAAQPGCCLPRPRVCAAAPRACCPGPGARAGPACSWPLSSSACHRSSGIPKTQSWGGPQDIHRSLRGMKCTQISSDGCLSDLLFKNVQGTLSQDFPVSSLLCLTSLRARKTFFPVSNPVLPCGKLSQATIKMENN